MKYEQLARYSDPVFKRLVGIPRLLFAGMVEVLVHAETLKRKLDRPQLFKSLFDTIRAISPL